MFRRRTVLFRASRNLFSESVFVRRVLPVRFGRACACVSAVCPVLSCGIRPAVGKRFAGKTVRRNCPAGRQFARFRLFVCLKPANRAKYERHFAANRKTLCENSPRKFSARQLMFPRCFAEGFLIVIKRSATRRNSPFLPLFSRGFAILFAFFFFYFAPLFCFLCQVYCSLGKYRRSQCRQNRIKQSASKHDICLRI